MSKATRWGILGAGEISNDWSVAVSTLSKDEHQIIAVAARDVSRAKTFAELHKIPKVHKNYDELLSDKEVDVVYVGILHSEHFKICKKAIELGKNVLCEKPLCMNVKETKELVELVKKKKVFFMEAIWSRFFPAYQRLKEEIEKGTIGEVIQVRAEMGIRFPEDNWRRDLKQAGGSVLDMGTYTCQFAAWCFRGQKPLKIIAGGQMNSSGADDSSSATLIYPNGGTATLITHTAVNLPSEAIVVGTKGSIKMAYPFWCSTKLEFSGETSGSLEFELPKSDQRINFWNSTGLSYQCKEVRRCLQKGLTESPDMSHDDTLLLAEMREQIRKQIGVKYPQD